MTRGGRKAAETEGPERRCIATGEVQPKHGLIRFVVGPDGQIVPDLSEKLPGRGIWVAAEMYVFTKKGKTLEHKTILRRENTRFNQSLDENLFTARQLEKGVD